MSSSDVLGSGSSPQPTVLGRPPSMWRHGWPQSFWFGSQHGGWSKPPQSTPLSARQQVHGVPPPAGFGPSHKDSPHGAHMPHDAGHAARICSISLMVNCGYGCSAQSCTLLLLSSASH